MHPTSTNIVATITLGYSGNSGSRTSVHIEIDEPHRFGLRHGDLFMGHWPDLAAALTFALKWAEDRALDIDVNGGARAIDALQRADHIPGDKVLTLNVIRAGRGVSRDWVG